MFFITLGTIGNRRECNFWGIECLCILIKDCLLLLSMTLSLSNKKGFVDLVQKCALRVPRKRYILVFALLFGLLK